MAQQGAFKSQGVHVTVKQLAGPEHGSANYLGQPGVALEGPRSERAQRCAGREAVLGAVQRPHHAHAGRVRGLRLQAPGLQYLNLSSGTVSQSLLSSSILARRVKPLSCRPAQKPQQGAVLWQVLS